MRLKFPKTFCINLKTRPERWDLFRLDWPTWLPDVVQYQANVVSSIPSAVEWPTSIGAWGCYQSHLSILEMCSKDAIDVVAIFEDDACPCDDIHEKLLPALDNVPDDWDMLYLGGQLLDKKNNPPHQVNKHWSLAHNVNRMHAYVIRQPALDIAIKHLYYPERWTGRKHCDHRLGELHAHMNVYVPPISIFGQRAGKSDINAVRWPKRFWKLS